MEAFVATIVLIPIAVAIVLLSIRAKNALEECDLRIYPWKLEDSFGHRMDDIWAANIAGVTYNHSGYSPQRLIPQLPHGARIMLAAEPENKYDKTAIRLTTASGKALGYYPATGFKHQELFDRITRGEEVVAIVNKTGASNGICWCEIKVMTFKH